ncbi:VOC family protein [Nocardia sp. IFM 10818]
MITGIFPTICADDVAATRDFYTGLLGFKVIFDSGWYVQLEAPAEPKAQIGIVEREHASVPAAFRNRPAGVLISVEVEDVDAVHARAVEGGLEIPLELRTEDFGQRHFMTVDPSGTLVDIITNIPITGDYSDALPTD